MTFNRQDLERLLYLLNKLYKESKSETIMRTAKSLFSLLSEIRFSTSDTTEDIEF